MRSTLLWSVFALIAIACIGFFASAQQGPPGFGPNDYHLLHTTFGAGVAGYVLFTCAVVAAGLSLFIASQVIGGRMRRRHQVAMLMYTSALMARLASYIEKTRRALGSVPESHYRNSRTYCAGV